MTIVLGIENDVVNVHLVVIRMNLCYFVRTALKAFSKNQVVSPAVRNAPQVNTRIMLVEANVDLVPKEASVQI